MPDDVPFISSSEKSNGTSHVVVHGLLASNSDDSHYLRATPLSTGSRLSPSSPPFWTVSVPLLHRHFSPLCRSTPASRCIQMPEQRRGQPGRRSESHWRRRLSTPAAAVYKFFPIVEEERKRTFLLSLLSSICVSFPRNRRRRRRLRLSNVKGAKEGGCDPPFECSIFSLLPLSTK